MKNTLVNVLIILLLIAAGFCLGYFLSGDRGDSSALYSEIDSLYQEIAKYTADIAVKKAIIDSLEIEKSLVDTLILTEIKYIKTLPYLTTDSLARLTAITYRSAHPEEPIPGVMASGTRMLIDRAIAIDYIGVRRASDYLSQRLDISMAAENELKLILADQENVIKNYQVINGNFERLVIHLSRQKDLLQGALIGTATTAILIGLNVREGTALGAGAGVFVLSYNFDRIKKIVGFIF